MNVARRQAPVSAALLTLALAAPAAAQLTEAGTPIRPPGWALTPAVGVSEMWDDNPTLAVEGDVQTGDFVTAVRPSLTLGYRGKRTQFRSDYAGSFDFYRQLTEQNTRDHRGAIDLEYRASRGVTIFVRDQAAIAPTTGDLADIAPTALRRQTTRTNAFRAGADAVFGPRTTLSTAYASQWVDFSSPDPLADATLLGGMSHGGNASFRRRVTPRVALGADYDLQHAVIDQENETFDVQSALAVAELTVSPGLAASFGYGHAWLAIGSDDSRRNGQAYHAALDWHGRRVGGTVRYARTFLPSFGFGGTFQNEELRGTLRVALSRWTRWTATAGASNNEPLEPGDPTVRTLSAQTSLGVIVKRYVRLEVFGQHVFQNSSAVGGRVHRTRAGVQATVAGTVRAR